ncbi:MAG TPA: NAD(P)H-binding protein [Paludibacter sp.]
MKQKIKIAVIGGTGKSGKYLVEQLVDQGFQLKMLIRNPANFQATGSLIEVIEGNVADYNSVYSLIEGCHAVISTLGLGIPASEPTIFSRSTSNVIKAMAECNVQRYIVTTGLNVDTPFDKKSGKTSFGTDWMKKTYPVSTADKQLEYEILAGSTVDWTLVRLPMIELTERRYPVDVSLEDCAGDKISATDLAHFLIEQLSSEAFVRKSPFLYNV